MELLLQLLTREFRAFKTEILDRIASLEAAVQAAASANADAPQPVADATKPAPARDTKAGA